MPYVFSMTARMATIAACCILLLCVLLNLTTTPQLFKSLWWTLPMALVGPTPAEVLSRPLMLPFFLSGLMVLCVLLFLLGVEIGARYAAPAAPVASAAPAAAAASERAPLPASADASTPAAPASNAS